MFSSQVPLIQNSFNIFLSCLLDAWSKSRFYLLLNVFWCIDLHFCSIYLDHLIAYLKILAAIFVVRVVFYARLKWAFFIRLRLRFILTYVIFVDEFSHNYWIFFVQKKDQTFSKFCEFKVLAEKESGKKLKDLRSNNGGEYIILGKFWGLKWAS